MADAISDAAIITACGLFFYSSAAAAAAAVSSGAASFFQTSGESHRRFSFGKLHQTSFIHMPT